MAMRINAARGGPAGSQFRIGRQYLAESRQKLFEDRDRSAKANFNVQMKDYNDAVARGDTTAKPPVRQKVNAPRTVPAATAAEQALVGMANKANTLATALSMVGRAGMVGVGVLATGVMLGLGAVGMAARRVAGNQELSGLNSGIGGAYARLETGRYARNLAYAQAVSAGAANAADQQNRFEKEALPIRAGWGKTLDYLSGSFMHHAGSAASGANQWLDAAGRMYGFAYNANIAKATDPMTGVFLEFGDPQGGNPSDIGFRPDSQRRFNAAFNVQGGIQASPAVHAVPLSMIPRGPRKTHRGP